MSGNVALLLSHDSTRELLVIGLNIWVIWSLTRPGTLDI
jgi:hypothetical protein